MPPMVRGCGPDEAIGADCAPDEATGAGCGPDEAIGAGCGPEGIIGAGGGGGSVAACFWTTGLLLVLGLGLFMSGLGASMVCA